MGPTVRMISAFTRKHGPERAHVARAAIAFALALGLASGCAAPAAPSPTASKPAAPAPTTAAPAPAAATAAPAAKPAAPAGPLKDVSSRKSISVSGVNAPYALGKERGFYRDEGINVQLNEGTGSGQPVQLVAAGTDTFGFADTGTIMQAREQGVPLKIVGPVIQRSQIVIVTHANSGITRPKDLEGKSLALSPGSAATVVFPAFAAANNVDVSKINQVSLSIPAAITALRERQVDANAGFTTSAVIPLQVAGVKLDVMNFADWGTNTLGTSIFVRESLLSQDPDLVRRFVRASYKSVEAAKADPQAAVDAYMRAVPAATNKAIVMGQLEVDLGNLNSDRTKGQPVGRTDPQDWNQTIEILMGGGLLKSPKPISEYFDPSFLP